MKKFEVLRYLKKFRVLIFIVALLGSLATYLYGKSNQKYTASVVIKYTNSAINDGFAPDGTKLDVNEIYSSAVITQAMEYLGSNGPLNIIRSRCSVTQIIPDDQKVINDAKLDKGEEVTYFPDTYKVNLVVDGQYGSKYARSTLDAIMQAYCTYYTEKYVEQKLSINPSSDLIKSGNDYYESISILEDDTNAMLGFLMTRKENYPDFRSSKTGYSYSDLYEIYKNFRDYKIPELYAKVLSGPQTKDGEILRNFIANEISSSEMEEEIKTEQRAKVSLLADNFVQQNKEILGGTVGENGRYFASDLILRQLEDHIERDKTETTYDSLILEMVDIDKVLTANRIDRGFLTEVGQKFGELGSGSSGTDEEHSELESLIDSYEDELKTYFEIVSTTSKELNLSISADYLKMISSVRVYPSINIKLYIVLALVFFLIVGCAGAIILGRAGDIMDYFLYTDKKTGLPNREKLNIYIDSLSESILPDDFTCFAIQFENLGELTRKFGYSVGDSVLKDFSDLVRLMGDSKGVIGYNGAGSYLAFFEKCSHKKANTILKVLGEYVQRYNELNYEYPIKYSAAGETTSDSGLYKVRELLRSAISKAKENRSESESEKND